MTKKERRMTLVRGDYYLGSDEVGEVAKMVKHGKRLIDWLGLPLLGLPWLAWCCLVFTRPGAKVYRKLNLEGDGEDFGDLLWGSEGVS